MNRKRIDRCLQHLIESTVAGCCVTCGHLRHNELGYCQTRSCSCSNGTSVKSTAQIIQYELNQGETP